MTCLPIIMGPHSVPRLLDDSKTQTRRLVVPAKLKIILTQYVRADVPFSSREGLAGNTYPAALNPRGAVSILYPDGDQLGVKPDEFQWTSRWGTVRNRVWVREALVLDGQHWVYACDGKPVMIAVADQAAAAGWAFHKQTPTCPAMMMPRWASRVTCTIKGLRVERLQAITAKDAIAEGLTRDGEAAHQPWGVHGIESSWNTDPVQAYAAWWDDMNAKKGEPFTANAWVYVLDLWRLRTDADMAAHDTRRAEADYADELAESAGSYDPSGGGE